MEMSNEIVKREGTFQDSTQGPCLFFALQPPSTIHIIPNILLIHSRQYLFEPFPTAKYEEPNTNNHEPRRLNNLFRD